MVHIITAFQYPSVLRMMSINSLEEGCFRGMKGIMALVLGLKPPLEPPLEVKNPFRGGGGGHTKQYIIT